MTSEAPGTGPTSPVSKAPALGEVVRLDNRRTPCAVGLIRAAEVMAGQRPGTVLEMWSKDRFAPYEVPVWASRDGHEVLSQGRSGWWPFRYFVFRIRKSS